MAEIFESRERDLQGYLDAIPTVPGQVGAVYAIGGEIAGLEVFDAATTYHKMARKLLSSYALDAMECAGEAQSPTVDSVKAFIDAVRSAPSEQFPAAGLGATVRLSSDAIAGAALEVAGDCVHLSAFGRQTFTDEVDAQRPVSARMQKGGRRS
jgi:hypothetical protein